MIIPSAGTAAKSEILVNLTSFIGGRVHPGCMKPPFI